MKKWLLMCFIMIIPFTGNAQFKIENKKDVFLFNAIGGGIIGGIGSMINKKDDNTFKAFVKGFYKGALGGTLVYGGKQMLSNFSRTHNYSYIWASKAMTYSGISMIENAAANKKILSDLHFNLYFFRIDYRSNNNFVFRPRAMLFSIISTCYTIEKYDMHFNKKISLWTGSPVFSDDKKLYLRPNLTTVGQNFLSGFWVTEKQTSHSFEAIISHEMIHVYQYEMFSPVNNYFSISNTKIGKSKFYKSFTKYFYLDYNAISFRSFYYLSSKLNPNNYYGNPFEGEAAVISLQNK